MSDPKTVPASAQIVDETTYVPVKHPYLHNAKAFVKRHKRPLLAGGALVSLVGLSAYAGRATSDVTSVSPSLEIETDSDDNDNPSDS